MTVANGIADSAFNLVLIAEAGFDQSPVETALLDAGRTCTITSVNEPDTFTKIIRQQRRDAVLYAEPVATFSVQEALAIIRQHGSDMPLIVLSDNDAGQSVIDWMKAGAHDCVARRDLVRLPFVLQRDIASAIAYRELDAKADLPADMAGKIPGYVFQRVQSPDGSSRFTYLSESLLEQFGVDPEPLKADPANFWSLIHPDDRESLAEIFSRSHSKLVPYHTEYRAILPDDRVVWVRVRAQPTKLDNGDVVWNGLGLDVTTEKSDLERLNYLAYYDAVTGLPNRHLFFDRLGHLIRQIGRSNTGFALHIIDLDDFKQVNDTYGHAAGDILLRQIAVRLSENIRDADTLARLGGDEFTLIQTGVTELSAAAHMAAKLLEGLEQPFTIEGQKLTMHASIGIGCYGAMFADLGDLDHEAELIRRADLALYDTKRKGGAGYRYYTDELQVS